MGCISSKGIKSKLIVVTDKDNYSFSNSPNTPLPKKQGSLKFRMTSPVLHYED